MTKAAKDILKVIADEVDPFARVREIVATGYATDRPGDRHGYSASATPEIFGIIGATTSKPKATIDALKAIRKQFQTLWGDHSRYAGIRVSEAFQTYLAEQSEKILANEPIADFFDEAEFAAERSAKLNAQKNALFTLSKQAHELLVPIFESAIVAGWKLLGEELATEISRCKKFGIPMTEPSPFMLAIRGAIQFYESRKSAPTSVASIDDLCVQTIQFD